MKKKFHLLLIKPSRYDDDGYVIQWRRVSHPVASLMVLNALAEDCAKRSVLGPDVDIRVEALEDQSGLPPVAKMIHRIKQAGAGGLVGFVGVHSAQFPRTADLARQFRAADVPVVIGGFHVSGSMIMLPETPPELQEMLDLGVSLFVGEGEGRLEQVIQDAHLGQLRPVYNYSGQLVDLDKALVPTHLPKSVEHNLIHALNPSEPIEAGRGCPFNCSFCSVINVHGRKARTRSPETIISQIRNGLARGRSTFFFTDDNFPRNPRWREILETLVDLREKEGVNISFTIQVDAQSDRDPDFIPLAVRAGCSQIFVGMESINPAALAAVGKKHNTVERYQQLFLAWKRHGVQTMAGYILGFPTDTPASIRRDIETIKQELALDMPYFFVLTPLPGSADHRDLVSRGVPLAEDLALYTTFHATLPLPHMSCEELQAVYDEAWQLFYDDAHCETIMRRHAALGGDMAWLMAFLLPFRGVTPIERVFPSEIGFFRIKSRRERRPGFPKEPLVRFLLHRCRDTLFVHLKWARLLIRMIRIAKRVKRSGNRPVPKDPALAPLPGKTDTPDG